VAENGCDLINSAHLGTPGRSAAKSPEHEYQVVIASNCDDRADAYRTQYRVYVEEQQKAYSEADHLRGWLTDPLDRNAIVVLVRQGGAPCGTVRATFADHDCVKSHYANLFELGRFDRISDASISVCSRLAVLPGHRATAVSSLLFTTIYECGLKRNTQLSFSACAPELIQLFVRYGFREFSMPFVDPVVGTLHRMVLALDDLVHLEHVRSPFLAVARRFGVRAVSRPWINLICGGGVTRQKGDA
jgi:predicted GNAT family N-acyltransferase